MLGIAAMKLHAVTRTCPYVPIVSYKRYVRYWGNDTRYNNKLVGTTKQGRKRVLLNILTLDTMTKCLKSLLMSDVYLCGYPDMAWR